MSSRLREGWLVIALVVALGAAGALAYQAIHFGQKAHSGDESIRPWMSLPYIAHSRKVPQKILWIALGIPAHSHDHRPIGRIARDQKRSVDDVISTLKSAIDHAPKQRPVQP